MSILKVIYYVALFFQISYSLAECVASNFRVPLNFPMLFQCTYFLACASLKNYGENMEKFPGSLKYDAKHWANA